MELTTLKSNFHDENSADDVVIHTRQIHHVTLSHLGATASLDSPQHHPEVCTTEDSDGEQYEITYQEDKIDRGAWAGKVDFILTCVSFAVGLGNVWRFPYLVYKNGGGAFLIPYGIMLILCGLPLFFLEFAFGQFSSLGPISCWIISPLFKGVGYGMVIMTCYLASYYIVIISHCLMYLGASFNSKLPWVSCGNYWNDNSTCFDNTNETMFLMNSTFRVSATEQYYDKFVLNISDGIDNFGFPSWKLSLCLLFCWVVVLAVLIKGVKSLGKISYFTASFPYVMLTILLLRGIFLQGSLNGIYYYLIPKFERLKDPVVWTDAATQIFFSLSCCNGGLINMASYNKFKNNCCRDAIIVAIINCATSVFAGFVIFANLGFMAYVKNVTIDQVAKGGPGLVFVVYPEALSNMPIAPMWSVFFFIMMLTLGFGSEFALVETIISGFQDELAKAKIITTERRRFFFRCFVCALGFLCGLPMLCPGGIYLLTLLDITVGGYPLLLLGLLEILIICYFYGIKQFKKDISLMTGSRPNWYWRLNWLIITPLVLIFLLIFYFAAGEFPKYGNYSYPTSWKRVSNVISIFPMLIVPLLFAVRYCRDGGYILLKEYMKPQSDWGPAKDNHREEFMDLIRSTDSFKKKCIINDGGDVLEGEDTKFFQSKQSIIEKLNKVVNKEIERNYIGSSGQITSKDGNLNINGEQKLIKSSTDIAKNSLLV